MRVPVESNPVVVRVRIDIKSLVANGMAVLRAKWYLRAANRVGQRVRVWGNPVVKIYNGQLIIGERVRLVSTIAPLELVANGGTLEIGNGSFINYGSSISASQLVRIGDRCTIGTYCMLMDNDFHRLEPEMRQEVPESGSIILEENVWLGARVIVLKGVTIGAGSAIGAGSVVTKSVPPRCLAVGVPAKVIRSI